MMQLSQSGMPDLSHGGYIKVSRLSLVFRTNLPVPLDLQMMNNWTKEVEECHKQLEASVQKEPDYHHL